MFFDFILRNFSAVVPMEYKMIWRLRWILRGLVRQCSHLLKRTFTPYKDFSSPLRLCLLQNWKMFKCFWKVCYLTLFCPVAFSHYPPRSELHRGIPLPPGLHYQAVFHTGVHVLFKICMCTDLYSRGCIIQRETGASAKCPLSVGAHTTLRISFGF